MSDFRSYAPDLDTATSEITLNPFESHHLLATNRARMGDEVVLFNGAGLESLARISTEDRRRCVLTTESFQQHPDPSVKITLAIAIIKGKTFDTILRQATELGVYKIQPLLTDWTQVQIKDADSKIAKWEQHLIEGCKQSGNPWLPRLEKPAPLTNLLEGKELSSAVVASLEDDKIVWDKLSIDHSPIVFVGPEGDFTPDEYKLLKARGAQPVSLGPLVLRSETAVVSAISILKATVDRTVR